MSTRASIFVRTVIFSVGVVILVPFLSNHFLRPCNEPNNVFWSKPTIKVEHKIHLY